MLSKGSELKSLAYKGIADLTEMISTHYHEVIK